MTQTLETKVLPSGQFKVTSKVVPFIKLSKI